MNTGMIYQLVITGIILLFGILYMRLLFKCKRYMQAFNLKKYKVDVMEKAIDKLMRENSDLRKELEKVCNENELYRKN